MPWVKARDVSFLGSDAAAAVAPSQVEGVGLPVHILTVVAMGVDLFDNQNLEDLAETADPSQSSVRPEQEPAAKQEQQSQSGYGAVGLLIALRWEPFYILPILNQSTTLPLFEPLV